MKRVSKVLAVVLALTMLFATSVLPASAADLDNATLKLSFKNAAGEEITSAAAGDVIDVYVSLKVDAYVQAMQFYVNYNSDYVTHSDIRKDVVTEIKNAKFAGNWLGDFAKEDEIELTEGELYEIDAANLVYGYYLNWGAGATMTITPYNASTMPTPPLATTQLVKVVYATETNDQTLLVNTKGEYYEMIQLRFIAAKDIATIDDSIFFFDNDLEKVIINIDSENVPFSTLAINSAKNLNVSFEYASGSGSGEGGETPVVAPVSSKEVQVKWKDKANNEIFIGFCGEYTGTVTTTEDPVTGKKIVNEIYEIGFRMSTSDETLATYTDIPAETLYDFGSGTYKFRAVTASTTDSALPLYGKAYIQLTKDSDKLLASDMIKTTVKAEYDEAAKNAAFGA